MMGKGFFAVRVLNQESRHQIIFLVLAQTSTGTQKPRSVSKFPICRTTQVWFINESKALRHLWIENSTKLPDYLFPEQIQYSSNVKKKKKLNCVPEFSLEFWIIVCWTVQPGHLLCSFRVQRKQSRDATLKNLFSWNFKTVCLFFCHSNKLQIDESWRLERRSPSPIAWTEPCQLEQVVQSCLGDL